MKRGLLIGICVLLNIFNVSAQNNIAQKDMKKITVKKIKTESTSPAISNVNNILNANKIPYNAIDQANWDAFPYKPDVKFRIAWNGTEIFLQYIVKEKSIRALYDKDEGALPFKDSCVEFFMIPSSSDSIYYNLEMNCIGIGTFAGGAKRTERKKYSPEEISVIRRESSLGSDSIESIEGDFEWTLTLIIPVSLYNLSDFPSLSGREVRANFYKCGDETPDRHYISWNPIGSPRPNFHTPEYFGILFFE